MNKTLAVLGMLAVLFGATLHANALNSASAAGAARTADRRMVPPILSQAGPQAPVTAQPGAPAPTRITPVRKGPGETFAPTAADWAVYLKDSSHSCRVDVNPTSDLSSAWTYVAPGGGQTAFSGSPVESDGIICFTSSDGYLYAVNRSTGAAAWAPKLLGASTYRGGTPVIWQGRVVTEMVTSASTSSVFCCSLATGDSLWTTAIPNTPGLWNVYLSRPIVLTVSGTPYVFLGCFYSTTARVIGLNMNTGAIVYDQQWPSNVFIGGLATDGTDLYAPLQTTGVVKLHPATPPAFDTLWTQHPGPGASSPVNGTPVYCNGQVFAVKGAIAGPESLYAINAATGTTNWIRQVGNGTMGLDLGSPAVDGDNVYMYASNFSTAPYSSQVMAYHQSDGGDAWGTYYTTTDGLTDGGMAITTGANKRLYIGTGFGASSYGHMIVLNAADGTLEQDLPYATDYIYNSVCRPSGGLYILTYGSYAAGTLIGYNVTDATQGFKVLLAIADDSGPALAADILAAGAGAFTAVDYVDWRTSTLSNVDSVYNVAGYQAILTWPNYAYQHDTMVGDSLAKYVELHGGVVSPVWCEYASGNHMEGRYMARYNPVPFGGNLFTLTSLGTVQQPGHPIMQGVSAVAGTYVTDVTTIKSSTYASRIADWSTGQVECATYDSLGYRTAFLGFWPNWRMDLTLTGDYLTQVVNALKWVHYTAPTGQEEVPTAKVDYSLLAAPNPFAGKATISYSLPAPANVSLKLYDVTGSLVSVLASGRCSAGRHSVSICNPQSGRRLAQGVYLLRLETGGQETTKKLILE